MAAAAAAASDLIKSILLRGDPSQRPAAVEEEEKEEGERSAVGWRGSRYRYDSVRDHAFFRGYDWDVGDENGERNENDIDDPPHPSSSPFPTLPFDPPTPPWLRRYEEGVRRRRGKDNGNGDDDGMRDGGDISPLELLS